MMDRVGAFFRERTVKRVVSIALFVTLLVLFRQLFVLLLFFVSFERLIGWPAEWLAHRTRLGKRGAVAVVALGLLVVLGALAGVGVGRAIHVINALRSTLPDRVAA